jgi:4a-hydroxytetrahydrobiopterin dehydratase
MERKILDAEALENEVARMPDWTVESGQLRKRWKFDDFAGSLAFVNKVAELAEAADHHPDITFGWGYAQLILTTHDRGGVTDVDVALAKQIDRIE